MSRPNSGPHLVRVANASGGEYWYIRWTPAGGGRGRERSTGVRVGGREQEAAAQRALAKFLEEQGKSASERKRLAPEEARIGAILKAYMDERGPNVVGRETIEHNVTALTKFWGGMTVSAITPVNCAAYAAQRKVKLPLRGSGAKRETEAQQRYRPIKPATVNRELTTLQAACNHAVAEKRLTEAPTIKFLDAGPQKDRWLTRDDVAALLRAARSLERAKSTLTKFILLAIYIGGRAAAVLDLAPGQINLERKWLDLNPPDRPRTKKRRPIQPLTRKLAWFLPRWMAKTPKGAPIINRNGGQRVGSIKKSFAEACRIAGIKNATPNTLRHTSGTWMAHDGVDMIKIGAWLGHTQAKTTALYAHHHPDYMADAKAALDRPRKKVVSGKSQSTGILPKSRGAGNSADD